MPTIPFFADFGVFTVLFDVLQTGIDFIQKLCVAFFYGNSHRILLVKVEFADVFRFALRGDIIVNGQTVGGDRVDVTVLKLEHACADSIKLDNRADFTLVDKLLNLVDERCSYLDGNYGIR